jgi:hypothetical protein
MLKLILGEEGGIAQGATIPVRWCVDKETLEKINQKAVRNPYVLIVNVAKNNYGDMRTKDRYLFPLDQALDYIQFTTPGKNILYATIVWSHDGKYNTLWERFLKRDSGFYNTDVIDADGNFIFKGESYYNLEFCEVEVTIPGELFAKERPRWLKNWTNLWFTQGPRDECAFRKRMILAFTIQPVIYLVYISIVILVRIITCVALLLFGARKINFQPIFHPIANDNESIWDYWTEKEGYIKVIFWNSDNRSDRPLLWGVSRVQLADNLTCYAHFALGNRCFCHHIRNRVWIDRILALLVV